MRAGLGLHRRGGVRFKPHFVLAGLLCTHLSAQTLRIYHIDVEQGDSTLLVAPNGKTLLVDSGKNGHGDRIKAVLDQAGVAQIDFLVTTHYDDDHYGGIDELGVRVVKAYDRGEKNFVPDRKKQQVAFKDYQHAAGKRASRLRRGMTIPLDPTMEVTCIASGGVVIDEKNPSAGSSENGMSIALLVGLGDFRYFVGGDLDRHTESKIAARDLVLDVDVYRANNHGSNKSSSPAFLGDLSPAVVIITSGNSAYYQHPRRETLGLYRSLPVPPTVFQTNKYLQGVEGGNVPDRFIADERSSGTDGTILVSVDSGAGTYRVSFAPDSSYPFLLKERRTQNWEEPEIAVENPLRVAASTNPMVPDSSWPLYFGLMLLMSCMIAATAGYFRITRGKAPKLAHQRPELLASAAAASGGWEGTPLQELSAPSRRLKDLLDQLGDTESDAPSDLARGADLQNP